MGNENYIQNPKLQNEQMKDENEVFNSFINVMAVSYTHLTLPTTF